MKEEEQQRKRKQSEAERKRRESNAKKLEEEKKRKEIEAKKTEDQEKRRRESNARRIEEDKKKQEELKKRQQDAAKKADEGGEDAELEKKKQKIRDMLQEAKKTGQTSVSVNQKGEFSLPGSNVSTSPLPSSTSSVNPNQIRVQPWTENQLSLIEWLKYQTKSYPGVAVKDFTKSWLDGLAFVALMHSLFPDDVDFEDLREKTAVERNQFALDLAEKLGVERWLDPEDVGVDRNSMMTYMAEVYKKLGLGGQVLNVKFG
eukprot:TRINITY_DN1069_c0_g1_i1.p1 TRINITY_DN1069_c0_g1~~TRINITY_DN1069_c0_g1_i1.p1  ORF type:complete len:259 (+),score=107.42 TRINITY_DN1069_c0_g1_i1:294-1070(+)